MSFTDFDYETVLRLEDLKKRWPYAEDRSTKTAFLSARCFSGLKEDFDYVARCIEGEEPAIVLRRLVRQYVKDMVSRSD